MSHVEGADELVGKLDVFGQMLGKLNYELHDREMVKAQKEAVSLIPIDTGRASEALASDDALQRMTNADTGETRWAFGFVTLAIEKAAFYLFWVEFGTKGSKRGELVAPGAVDGRSRTGRFRTARRKKRGRPPMPAQPWFRPARSNLFRRLQDIEVFEQMVRAAKRVANFADSD